MGACILWFRHGLRLHDNPALLEAVKHKGPFYPIFIFDGETAGTFSIGYNRMKFLLESLQDLDNQLRKVGSRLYIFRGSPTQIFYRFWQELGLSRLCFEQDCETIWKNRDDTVKAFCKQYSIECIEKVSHTLWNPFEVLTANGGSPPLTYQMFLHTVSTIGDPSRPVATAEWSKVNFGKLTTELGKQLNLFNIIPSPQDLGIIPENPDKEVINQWIGGETHALKNLQKRLIVEEKAFRDGYYLPNQVNPDLLGLPTSQSAALRYGCLSVRKFYWCIQDLYSNIYGQYLPANPHITGQLIWREYFYTMSVNNVYYAEMERNPICLNIPWNNTSEESRNLLQSWKDGKTGFPFIDAAMRQLLLEGWIHHISRNAVACFLTRGDLWISWEDGLQHFLKYLLDADWSVCAGNWMWVSSSAFEQLLDCSDCICPVNFGRRLDPSGEYIKRYLPELKDLPTEYLYEPWCAPIEVQEKAKCVIGKDYPNRIVDHKRAANHNKKMMQKLRDSLRDPHDHCCPSNEEETRQFMWLSDDIMNRQTYMRNY